MQLTTIKGSLRSQKWMNFRKNSERSLTGKASIFESADFRNFKWAS